MASGSVRMVGCAAAVLLLALLSWPSATASAQTLTFTPDNVAVAAGAVAALPPIRVPAGHDFASETIGDPWDFEQSTDWNQLYSVDIDDVNRSAWTGTPTLADGVFTGTASSRRPLVSLQFEGLAGTFNMAGRNGVRYPIDGSKYQRLSFRARRHAVPVSRADDLMEATWFTQTARAQGAGGTKFVARGFDPSSGRYNSQMPATTHDTDWQIYKVDLDARHDGPPNLAFGLAWPAVARGFELGLGLGNELLGQQIELDWVQLTQRGTSTIDFNFSGFGGAVSVTARHEETGDVVQVLPDDGTNSTTFADGSSFTWDCGFLPPGFWFITTTGPQGTATRGLIIDPAPVITILDPDVAGGRDFASTVLNDPWDLANREDVERDGRLWDVTDATFGPGGLDATAQGPGGDAPGKGDAHVAFLWGPTHTPNELRIPAETYSRFTFTLEYLTGKALPGPVALGSEWGSLYQVVWQGHDHLGGEYSETLPIVMLDGGPQTFSMDLKTLTKTGPVEPALKETSPAVWTGDVSTLRIDATAADGQDRPFWLSQVRLATDDAPNANGVFNVRWSVTDATFSRAVTGRDGADATVSLYYDTDTDPAGRVPFASNLPATDGSYVWDVSSLMPGTYYVYATIADSVGASQSRFSTGPIRVGSGAPTIIDRDADGLADEWEQRFGVTAPDEDEDGDGVSNLQEYGNGTDPRLPNQWLLAEGSTNWFAERLALVNPNTEPASIDVKFLLESGGPITRSYVVPGSTRVSLDVNAIVPQGPVSAVVDTTSGGVAVERSMFWGDRWYGGHTGKAVQESRTSWYLAEGDAAWFDTYVLLANANAVRAHVTVDYLLEGDSPIRREYDVDGNSRVTIHTNAVPGLAGRSFSTSVFSDQAITVERAMYFTSAGTFWVGGHEDAAVAAPATDWFVAEGCTGALFDTYLLLSNPNTSPVEATLRYLRPVGGPVVETRTLPALSRTTIPVEAIAGLESTEFSTAVSATGPIVVERAMYWPGGFNTWTEAHASAGLTNTGTRWVMAEGEQGGALRFDTYILLANPSPDAAQVTITLLRTDGRAPVSMSATLPANSRQTFNASQFAVESGEQFGIVIDSTNGVPIVAERAMYWDGGGVAWGGGSNETAVRIR